MMKKMIPPTMRRLSGEIEKNENTDRPTRAMATRIPVAVSTARTAILRFARLSRFEVRAL